MIVPGLSAEELEELRKNYAELTRQERYGIVKQIASFYGVSSGYMRKLLMGMRDLKDRRLKEFR